MSSICPYPLVSFQLCSCGGQGVQGVGSLPTDTPTTPPTHSHLSLNHQGRQSIPRTAPNYLIFGEGVGLAVQSSWGEVPELCPLCMSCDSVTCVTMSPARRTVSSARFIQAVLALPVGAGLGEVWAGKAGAVQRELSGSAGPAGCLHSASVLQGSGSSTHRMRTLIQSKATEIKPNSKGWVTYLGNPGLCLDLMLHSPGKMNPTFLRGMSPGVM